MKIPFKIKHGRNKIILLSPLPRFFSTALSSGPFLNLKFLFVWWLRLPIKMVKNKFQSNVHVYFWMYYSKKFVKYLFLWLRKILRNLRNSSKIQNFGAQFPRVTFFQDGILSLNWRSICLTSRIVRTSMQNNDSSEKNEQNWAISNNKTSNFN